MARTGSDPFAQTRMTLAQHLNELRKRLFRGVLALALTFFVAWGFKDEIGRVMLLPLDRAVGWMNAELVEHNEEELALHPELPRSTYFLSDEPGDQRLKEPYDPKPQVIGIGEAFFFAFRNCIYAALFIAGPYLLWEMWQFIAAGLYLRERRMVYAYFPFSVLLFAAGVATAYFLMMPFGIYYLQQIVPAEMAEFNPSLSDYLEFLSKTCLWAGLIFQLPILMQILIRLEVVGAATFSKYRRHYIVVAFLVCGIVTPGTDPYSQTFMVVPMILLYELGILLGRWSLSRRGRAGPSTP